MHPFTSIHGAELWITLLFVAAVCAIFALVALVNYAWNEWSEAREVDEPLREQLHQRLTEVIGKKHAA
jgi:hypothetical protein